MESEQRMKWRKGKKQKTEKPKVYTPQQAIKLAENQLNKKLNKLADFIETQKDWTVFDVYVLFNIVLKKDIEPQLKGRAKKKAEDALEAMEIIEEGKK